MLRGEHCHREQTVECAPSVGRAAGPRGRGAARDSLLERAVDYACDPAHGIDLVILAGDLFETHQPDAALTGRVIAALERLPMPLLTTPGNHDEITYAQSVYRRARWPGILVTRATPSSRAR